MKAPEPQKEHAWLQKLVGEWTGEGGAVMEAGQPDMTFKSTETVRSIGEVWVELEGTGEVPGGGIQTTVMTLGYDPARKKFVGTFIGSMMTNMWIYEGELDASGKVLTLHTEGPSFFQEGTTAPYRDVVEFVTDDHRILASHTPDADGNWQQFMTMHFHRKK